MRWLTACDPIPRFVSILVFALVAVICFNAVTFADDFECTHRGAFAWEVRPDGVTQRVEFVPGDHISTSEGYWITDMTGWRKVDLSVDWEGRPVESREAIR